MKNSNLSEEAGDLAFRCCKQVPACGVCVFVGIYETLCRSGITLCSPSVRTEIEKSLNSFSFGAGGHSEADCGAVVGASFAVSLAAGVGREEGKKRWISYYHVKEGVGKHVLKKYGSLHCRDIMYHTGGFAYDIHYPGRYNELSKKIPIKACCFQDGSIIKDTAGWAAGYIYDMINNPKDLSEILEKFS